MPAAPFRRRVEPTPPSAPAAPSDRHVRLTRQVRALLPAGPDGPAALAPFLDAVDASYRQADEDRQRLERLLDRTARELLERNERLETELAERARAEERLRRELDARRAAEESLRRSLVRLDAAQRVARIGYWEVDVQTGGVYWSDPVYEMFGFEPGGVTPSVERFVQMTADDDLVRIVETIRSSHEPEVREVSFAITWADGSVHALRASGEVVRDEDGRVVQLYGVCADVTEEEARRAELLRATARAEDLLRLKTTILDNMNHELRTPLTGILGYAELLEQEVDGDMGDFVVAILRGGRRLLDTLNSVLDLAQLESGSFELKPEAVDVRAEAEEALAILHPLAAQKGLDLSLTDGPDPVWAFADAAAVFRVLNGLIGNAVKFTEAGRVEVEVTGVLPDGGPPRARVRVRDTGPGIAPDFLPHLFEEFRQESDGYQRRHEGNGIGLTITRRLVELMGGDIRVESALGEGTTLEVTLPAAETVPLPARPPLPTAALWN